MIQLVDINEDNWEEARRLTVKDAQKAFLDSALGIIARGYIYRDCRARVLGIVQEDTMVGVCLVKDLDEDPACYDLQQFMIDQRYQGKGYGTEALIALLLQLKKEAKYDCVEVCVKNTDFAALRMYEKAGFTDSGYVDEAVPDCLNLMFHF